MSDVQHRPDCPALSGLGCICQTPVMPQRVLADDPYMSLPVSEFEALHQRIRDLEQAVRLHVESGHDQNGRLRSVL